MHIVCVLLCCGGSILILCCLYGCVCGVSGLFSERLEADNAAFYASGRYDGNRGHRVGGYRGGLGENDTMMNFLEGHGPFWVDPYDENLWYNC